MRAKISSSSRIEGENVHGCTGAVKSASLKLGSLPLEVVEIDNDDCYIIMVVAPYSLFHMFYVIIFHFAFLGGFSESSSDKSLGYSLQNISQLFNL